MGLAQVQRVLARLYTDASLREHFFPDPRAAGGELGLNSVERQQLAELSAQQVNLFAASLQGKRLHEVCKLLPLTRRVLGERFADLFRRFAETHVPQGIKKHREDARAFARFVANVVRAERLEPAWVVELVRYEAGWLKAAEPTCRWGICGFRHPVATLVRALRQGDVSPLPVVRPTIAVWFRLPRQKRLRHVVLSLPCLLSPPSSPSPSRGEGISDRFPLRLLPP